MSYFSRRNLNEFVAQMGIPRGPHSKVYLVDTENGDDDHYGKSWDLPLKTLAEAESRCVANRHDTVLFLSRATADNPAVELAWDKDYTHLIGVGSYLPGLGNRSRFVAAAAATLASTVTFSGNGCIIKNMQFGNEYNVGAIGVATVSGKRNYFENVFFMVPFSTTAASYSLKVSCGENTFKRCTIGTTTSVRTAATYGLWICEGTGDQMRNKFIDCEFLSWSSVTTHALVMIDVDIENECFIVFFENCLFSNYPGSGEAGGLLAVAIDDNMVAFHQIIMRGHENTVAGCTAVADPLTFVMHAEVGSTGATAPSGMLMATVNEA